MPDTSDQLPEFIAPMLAQSGRQPFAPFAPERDADYLFEVKWDGTRCLAFVDRQGVRLRNRHERDVTDNYPELTGLSLAPKNEHGLVLDGELIALHDGKPDLSTVMRRDQARSRQTIASLAKTIPVTYVVFDVLVRRFESLLKLQLHERRAILRDVLASLDHPNLLLSDGVVGGGRKFFNEVTSRGLEGIIAKRVTSTYLPGKRTVAWQKLKPVAHLHCVVLGYVPDQDQGIKSLIIATEEAGRLKCVGRVGSGLSESTRGELLPLLRARRRDSPLIPCDETGVWVEPGLYCVISCLERTRTGSLRAPVFRGFTVDTP